MMTLLRAGRSNGRVPDSVRYYPYRGFNAQFRRSFKIRKADSTPLVDQFKSIDELKTATNDKELLEKIQKLTKRPKIGRVVPRCFIFTKTCFKCCLQDCKQRDIPFSMLTPGMPVIDKLIQTFRDHVGVCCGKSKSKTLSKNQVVVFQLIEKKLEIYGAAQFEEIIDDHEKYDEGITQLWMAIRYQRWEPEIPLIGADSLVRCRGIDFDREFRDAGGLTKLFVIRDAANLGVVFPPANKSITQILEMVGKRTIIEPNNISTGDSDEINMEQFITEFEKEEKDRTVLLNLLNFNFTHIKKMMKIMKPPKLVKTLSMIENVKSENPELPDFHNTLLATMAGSFTDFHVDFGGTSVNMHIVKGKKIFFLLPPTEDNLKALEHSERFKDRWFGDVKKDEIRKVVLKAGDSFLMPSGWIHAVYTPVDSVVFSGGFLMEQHIEQQIRIYEFERALDAPDDFKIVQFAEIYALYLKKFLLPAVEKANEKMRNMTRNVKENAKFRNFLLIYQFLERDENKNEDTCKDVIGLCEPVKKEQEELQKN